MATLYFSSPEDALQNFIKQHYASSDHNILTYMDSAEILILSLCKDVSSKQNLTSSEPDILNNKTAQFIKSFSKKNYPMLKKVIFLSSAEVYGEGIFTCGDCGPATNACREKHDLDRGKWEVLCPICKEIMLPLPLSESDHAQPCSVLGKQLLHYENLLKDMQHQQGITITVLRLFQPYWGEKAFLDPSRNDIIAQCCMSMLKNMKIEITEDGNQLWDFTHGSDVMQAINLAIENNTSEFSVYNIGSGQHISFQELAAYLQEFLDRTDTELIFTENYHKGDVRHRFADISLANKELGYKPGFNIISGLEDFCNHIKTSMIPV